MYARYITIKSTPEHRKAIEKMANRVYGYAKSLKGFISITYVISQDETEYGSFSIWASKEDAEQAGDSIREKVMPALQEIITAPPDVVIMEVYEPESQINEL